MDINETLSPIKAPSSLNREFIELTARNAQKMPLPAFLICVFVALLAYPHVPPRLAIGWLVLVGVLLVTRWRLLSVIPVMEQWSEKKRVNTIIALNITGGVLQGSAVFFFPFLPIEDRAFQTLLFAGLATGVVNSTVGFPPACVPYVLLTLFPLSLCWALFPASEQGVWKDYFFAALGFIYTLILIGIARDTFKLFTEAVSMRAEQSVLNRKIALALADSERSNSAKTRFLASASHDLRQPVHTLSLMTAALMMRPLDKQTGQISLTLNETVRNLSTQLDALLDISKLDAGIVTPTVTEFDVMQLTRRLCDEFTPQAEAKNLLLKLQKDSATAVSSDPLLTESIFRNLISNAIKYTDAGSINIRVHSKPGHALWCIRDTGIGIDPSKQGLVFDEFYQLNNPARERARGLGLGLSIVRRLTALLSYELKMTSDIGEGTQFELLIPLNSNAPAAATTHDEVPGVGNTTLSGTTVLVVDDDASVRQATRHFLEAMNCTVYLAEGYDDAIELAQSHQPDLLIVDFRLNDGTNGLEVQQTLRRQLPGLPTLMITGDTAPNRLLEASGADVTLLHKPLDSLKLQQAISAALIEDVSQEPAR